MGSTRRAVIDVGTNSVKLLVADVAGREVRPVSEESVQTRLGQGFFEMRRLQVEPIAYSANVVADFARTARQQGARSIRVIATSAAREATNSDDLISAIAAAAHLNLEILSGEQEADWAFRGVTTDPELAQRHLLLLDVGGGSTQFILGHGDHRHFCRSFPLGTVRLMEQRPHGDPPAAQELAGCRAWLREFLRAQVRAQLTPALQRESDPANAECGMRNAESLDASRSRPASHSALRTPRWTLVGTGGTVSILARMEAHLDQFDRERIEATRLALARVRWHVEQLWRLPLAERQRLVGLPPDRADVILPGAAIYEAVMEEFGFGELRVSTRGLRFAAVLDGA